MIDFFIWVKDKVKKCCTSNRIADDPKNKEKDKRNEKIDENKEKKDDKEKDLNCIIENFSEMNDEKINNTESETKDYIKPIKKNFLKAPKKI